MGLAIRDRKHIKSHKNKYIVTALKQTPQSLPVTALPQKVSFGMIKQFLPDKGFTPFIRVQEKMF